MSGADYIGILVAALVGFAGVGPVEVLTLLDIQEWIELVVAALTFAVILFGTYEFTGALPADGTAGIGRVGGSQRSQGHLGPIP